MLLNQAKKQRRVGWLECCLILSVTAIVMQLSPIIFEALVDHPRSGHQYPARAELRTKWGVSQIRYWIYLPQAYSADSKWPLLLFLHGSGERGDNINLVLKSGPPALIASGKHVPMIVVSPQCGSDMSWNSQVLLSLTDYLKGQFSIDSDRVYIAGYSMGGSGTWDLACAAPERFAAAIPQCGTGNTDDAKCLINLPIWAFHGGNDTVVPLACSKRMVEAVNAEGGIAKLTVYQDQGHSICNITFFDYRVYEWLLQQRRASVTKTEKYKD